MDILRPSGEHRLRESESGLVLQLYLREGAFSVEIRATRALWDIQPEVPARG
jgi:hypothetical protein